jgi:hypothetical protein
MAMADTNDVRPFLSLLRLVIAWAVALGMLPRAQAEPVAEQVAAPPMVTVRELVTVTVKSGRTFTAEIDPRSDAAKLVLRFSKETSTILRPIEWTAVTEIRRGEAVLPIETVRTQAIAENAARPKSMKPSPALGTSSRGTVRAWPVRPAAGEEESPNAAAVRGPVRSITVDAHLANWDADVEADGLSLSLGAFVGDGYAAAVDGTLEVALIGERQPPYSRGNAFPVLARWTRQVTAAEIEAAGGYYKTRLEFQAVHPEYERWVSNHALVHVRFLVPGDGTFETSIDAVPMRRYSPVRERTEQAFGTRFLPNERTGRGHRESATFGP